MKSVIRAWPATFRGRATLTLCINQRKETFVASCGRRGALEIREELERALKAQDIPVTFTTIHCLGLCDKGPNARLAPANSWFHEIRIDDVADLVATVSAEIRKLDSMSEGDRNEPDRAS